MTIPMVLQDPKLFASFQKQVEETRALAPDLQEQHIILDTYSGFSMSQVRISCYPHAPSCHAAATAGCTAIIAACSALHDHCPVSVRELHRPQRGRFAHRYCVDQADSVQAAEERSLACYVAPVSWEHSSSGQPLLVASGGLLRARPLCNRLPCNLIDAEITDMQQGLLC